MKKLRIFLTAILLLFVLAFIGCQGKEAEPSIDDKAIFEEELSPLTEEELAKLEETIDFDEEMTPVDEADLDNLDIEPVDENEQDSGEETAEKEPFDQEVSDVSGSENGSSENSSSKVKEDGTYTSKDEVAVYLHTYGHLPSNFITKKEALDLGWVSKEEILMRLHPERVSAVINSEITKKCFRKRMDADISSVILISREISVTENASFIPMTD